MFGQEEAAFWGGTLESGGEIYIDTWRFFFGILSSKF